LSLSRRRQRLEQCGIEGGNVIGLAAGDEVAIYDYLFIDDFSTGVGEIRADRSRKGSRTADSG